MNEHTHNAMASVKNAIHQFMENLRSGIPAASIILKYKTTFLDLITPHVITLKLQYSNGADKQAIEQVLDEAAIVILQSGNLYFKQKPHATGFLEEHFMTRCRPTDSWSPFIRCNANYPDDSTGVLALAWLVTGAIKIIVDRTTY